MPERLRSKKILSNSIFLTAILIIAVISTIIFYQFDKLMKSNKWVIHTYEVILITNQSLNYLSYAESDNRGYLLFGNKSFIEDQQKNIDTIKNSLQKLMQLTNDNPEQNARVIKLINLISQRIALIVETQKLKIENKINTVAGEEILNKARLLSEEIRGQANEIIGVEKILLNERSSQALNEARSAHIVFIIGQLISIFFLLVAFFILKKELSARVAIASKTRNIESQLRSLINGAKDMIAALDLNFRYLIFNDAYRNEFRRVIGKEIYIGMPLEESLEQIPETKRRVGELWKESFAGNYDVKLFEYDVNGEMNTYEITPSPIKDDENHLLGIVHVIRNITPQIHKQKELQESYEKLQTISEELENKNEKITLLLEMSDIMLACSSIEEFSNVITKYCTKVLDFSSGNFYIMHPSKDVLEISAQWGQPYSQTEHFAQNQCWALRLGHIHYSSLSNKELICEHIQVDNQKNVSYLCMPLRAENDVFGLLYIEFVVKQANKKQLSNNERLIIGAFAEVSALALANVRLRENLRFQSIRDPLTSLYNRRYLEEFLTKQIYQSQRTKRPVALLLMDLDHFKRINDVNGHDAGDLVLKEFSQLLLNEIRPGDIASRYGGEEFVVVFYDTDVKSACHRAENIRKQVSLMHVKYGVQDIGPITISIGIAIYPNDAVSTNKLIETADKALYVAKNTGRNKAVSHSNLVKTSPSTDLEK